MQATLDEYKAKLEELGLEDKKLQDAYADLEARLQKTLSDMQATDEANAEAVADLKKVIEGLNVNLTAYGDVIPGLVQMIQSVVYVPETANGEEEAVGYKLGNKTSDLFVKATYEVTPAQYAAQLTDANVKFTTVPVKAAAAEIVDAEIVEAKDGRVTVLARVNKNNKETYAKLTTGGAQDHYFIQD